MKSLLHTPLFLTKIFTYLVYLFAIVGFVLTAGYFAVKFGLTNESGLIDIQRESFLYGKSSSYTNYTSSTTDDVNWRTLDEWHTIKLALNADKNSLIRAAAVSGISSRLIASQVIVEQLRFLTSDRELFKKIFQPLKLLGNQTQFSWGVAGIKQETAIEVENHLKDTTSPYYLGTQYEHLLDFQTEDVGKERFERITNEKDRYYSYLYVGLYLKQIMTQWKNAGYDVSTRADVLSTLYNIGFKYSKPNANPKSGGASIPVGDTEYSFGSLANSFYNSNELLDVFPR